MKPNDSSAPKSKRRRRLLFAATAALVAGGGLWFSIHHVPGVGPALADGARLVLGPKLVARLEDFAYALQDDVDRVRYRNAAPKTFWSATDAKVASTVPRGGFRPDDYQAPFASVAAPGDGRWVPIDTDVPLDAARGPALYKSVVHPDPKRSYAAVAIVALDLSRLGLDAVAGKEEPVSSSVSGADRPAIVPRDRLDDLVAAFNGGFKAMHGHYGMKVDGRELLPPIADSCTVAIEPSGTVEIGTWSALGDKASKARSFRQTPPCLIEGGTINPAVASTTSRWGASVSGETVIRRSGIGLDAKHGTLFYAFGESVTAETLARALSAAGATDAAQLDVNYWFPRFVLYAHPRGADPTVASTLVPGVQAAPREYVGAAEARDFFYVTKRRSPNEAARPDGGGRTSVL